MVFPDKRVLAFLDDDRFTWVAWWWLFLGAAGLFLASEHFAFLYFWSDPVFWFSTAAVVLGALVLAGQAWLGRSIQLSVLQVTAGTGVSVLPALIALHPGGGKPADVVLFNPPATCVIGEQVTLRAIAARSLAENRLEALTESLAIENAEERAVAVAQLPKGLPFISAELGGIDFTIMPDEAEIRPFGKRTSTEWQWTLQASSATDDPIPWQTRRFLRLKIVGMSTRDADGYRLTLVDRTYPVLIFSSWNGIAAYLAPVINFIFEHKELIGGIFLGLGPVVWLRRKKSAGAGTSNGR